MKKKVKKVIKKIKKKQQTKRSFAARIHHVWPLILIVAIFFVLGGMLLFSYGRSYTNRVLPGVHIGAVPIGGMTANRLEALLEEMETKMQNAGIRIDPSVDAVEPIVLFSGAARSKHISPVFFIDTEKEVESVLARGKNIQSNVARALFAWRSRVQQPAIALQHVTIDEQRIVTAMKEALGDLAEEPVDAALEILSLDPFTYEVSSSSPGLRYDFASIQQAIRADVSALDSPEISLASNIVAPDIEDTRMKAVAHRLESIIGGGSIALAHDATEQIWKIDTEQILAWLELALSDEEDLWLLNSSSTQAFIENTISAAINQSAADAVFEQNAAGRVVAFQASQVGRAVDVTETLRLIDAHMRVRNSLADMASSTSSTVQALDTRIALPVREVLPEQSLSELNDLGITELLGVGYSDFSGSPANRVKNIRNGMEKIRGMLIAPGEEFSTVEATKPYTLEAGYFEEKVIVGNEVVPGIGGGLCQISTTLFRSAMNSALDITERLNHGFAVSYYDVNGKPGVDATIYDNKPDFRFRNDTDGHILIWPEINLATSRLIFNFWGTADGRSGSFTEPVVHKWIPYGETQYIETTDLAPGEEKCKYPYTGAEASFTYHRTLADGTDASVDYYNKYRALPKICLVGVEASSVPEPEPVVEEEEEFMFLFD